MALDGEEVSARKISLCLTSLGRVHDKNRHKSKDRHLIR